jgi:hypothetical protein
MQNTAIILGAGSSKDYGYPLWGALKEQMIALNIGEYLEQISGLTAQDISDHKDAHAEFLQLQEQNPDYTLDRIVYEIDKPKAKHISPTGHYIINIAGHLLASIEIQNNHIGWVSEMQAILVEYLATNYKNDSSGGNPLSEIVVISLNYDRVFEYFIADRFFEHLVNDYRYEPSNLAESITLAKNTRLRILKPHGYICGLSNNNSSKSAGMNLDLGISDHSTTGIRYPGNDSVIPYADKRLLNKDTFLRMGRHMYVVDERGESDYIQANKALKMSDQVFCLGLSAEGICQSSLVFHKKHKVFLSNSEKDIETIRQCKQGPEFSLLGSNGARLDAEKFPQIFRNIALSDGS